MSSSLFLSVGAMKAGTTWLHQQLASHKDIHFCPEKEIHYFADPEGKSYMSMKGRVERYQQLVKNLKPDRLNPHVQRNLSWYATHYLAPKINDDWYRSLFDIRPPIKQNTKYVADFSNLYANLDIAGWDHVRTVFDDVRVVYTMRHPGKRIWSHFKFQHEYSGQAHKLAEINSEKINQFINNKAFSIHIDYAKAVQSLREILGIDRVKFFFFEDFREKPIDSLMKVERFLNIRPGEYKSDRLNKQVNPSSKLEIPQDFKNIANSLHKEQCEKLIALGFTIPESWKELL